MIQPIDAYTLYTHYMRLFSCFLNLSQVLDLSTLKERAPIQIIWKKKKKRFQRPFDQWKTRLKKINTSAIVHYDLGKYSFSLDNFWTPLIYMGIYIYIYIYHHHHHHVVPPARISLTLSRHFSLLFIASDRSSGLHPVFSHSCCMYVRAGRPAFAWPYVGVHNAICTHIY